jgi:ribonuclease HII
MSLELSFQNILLEAGCDEAGRGCLAGPVVAAAVILPEDFSSDVLNDSKKLNKAQRERLRIQIEKESLSYGVAFVSEREIEKINILQASIIAMHRAVDKLLVRPEFLSVDGNKFKPYSGIPHQTVIKGDGKYLNIAAASILAKTYRDEYMTDLSLENPRYGWAKTKVIRQKSTGQQLLPMERRYITEKHSNYFQNN